MQINSLQNPRVKAAAKLRHAHHRRRQGLMLVEGARCIGRALAGGVEMADVFHCPALAAEGEADLLERMRSAGATTFEVPPHVLVKIAYRDKPEGLLAVARIRRRGLDELPYRPGGLYVVAENLEKPGNLGAICRSADAAGVDGLILCDPRTDVTNPNVIRASIGTVFSVPLAEADSAEALAWLREGGLQILAATPEGDRDYTAVDMTAGTAIVLGSEHLGISETFARGADQRVRIAMKGVADSLNVAATATVLLFEAARQRQCRRPG